MFIKEIFTFVIILIYHMINNKDFASRIKTIMEYYNLTATTFAASIKVQPSSISHLLSGRNKPSLDFVIKVLDQYKEVELYWLLNGKGSFPKGSMIKDPSAKPELAKQELLQSASDSPAIDKIIVFYKDGYFKAYKPS